MPRRIQLLLLAVTLLLAGPAGAQSLADLLERGVDLSQPAQRAAVAAQMRGLEQAKWTEARRVAAARGLPVRLTRRDGTVMELMAFYGNRPVYAITHNVNAAISTGANLLQAPPFSITGAGFTVGIWDAGAVRSTHQEFGARISLKDGASPVDHSTHVGGTIAAAGVIAAAKGMATSVNIDSYEWTNDKSEMTARGATYPGEAGKIYLSNQSYGYVEGWNYTGLSSPAWDWWGNGTTNTAVEQDFGKYDTTARDSDSLAANAPYFLMFRSAGNDRYDNPSAGQAVSLTAGGTTAVTYDPAQHPPGDGTYKGGYDTLGYDAGAKNVVTIGSVSDAVSGGVRSVAAATLSGYSSCGPADDGRIKPDLVANGEGLYSTLSGSDTSYGSLSGTSMASPNATGSALLLVKYFDTLFPGQAMRASTLKALLIHTADDLGTPGPDYRYGWGLINVKAAADQLTAYHSNPGPRVIESRLTSASLTRVHAFFWDGVSPIRATLAWTDPAGVAVTTSDSRTARLVNNLDLSITAPDSTGFLPYVMPYVGDWTNAKLSAAATTGKNNTDNVEQVYIAAPSVPGLYQANVTVTGTLTNNVQNYSLIISGCSNAVASSPSASTITPASATSGQVVANIAGSGLLLGATVKLTKSGQPDITATGIESLGDTIKCRLDVTGRAAGPWNVVVTNPDGQTATLPNAFTIIGAIWQDDLESGATGWTHSASQGTTDNWALTTSQSHSSSHSFFAAGPAATNVDELYSPAIAIPSSASSLNLTFWHMYNLQSGRDGGVLEFSVDAGAWFDVTDANSGATFATGGYNSSFSTNGNPNLKNPLAPRAAWTGSTSTFSQVTVNLTDTAKYAGHTLRIRWRLATNNSTSSTGWWIDDLVLNGGTSAVNLPPSITAPASASLTTVPGLSTDLTVMATDDAGESALTYTWSYTGGSFDTPVTFTENGTNAAKATTALFTGAGTYAFTVTVRDADGLSASSSIDVLVQQTATSMSVAPSSVTVGKGATQLFAATVWDQFNRALTAPPSISWSASGGGTIATDGSFSASTVGGPYVVTAASGLLSATAAVAVTGETLTTWRSTHFTSTEIAAGLADDLADPDGDGVINLLEYALGTDPHAATPPLAPAIDASGRLSLTLTIPKALPGIAYQGEATGDLATWPTAIPVEVIVDGDPQTIRITDPISTSETAHRFLRLRVTSQ